MRDTRQFLTVLDAAKSYERKLRDYWGSAMIGYLPGNEASGVTAYDKSGNSRNATLAGTNRPTFGAAGIGDGKTSISCGGVNTQKIDWSSLNAAVNVSEGTLLIWLGGMTGTIWDDTTYDEIFNIYGDANNFIEAYKGGSPVRQIVLRYAGGGTTRFTRYGLRNQNWYRVAFTWSKSNNRIRVYSNGKNDIGEAGSLGTWGVSVAASYPILATVSTTDPFKGTMAHIQLLNKEATAEEIASEYRLFRNPKRISVIGDSIAAYTSLTSFSWMVRDTWNDGNVWLYNHAVTGQSIMSHMDAQVAAAATDDADVIILQLGTNDTSATGMQAEVEENIVELRASNPRAVIYYMNVLPRWTDVGGGTPVDKSAIRAAIAAACAAQGVTCWDTFTSPWITAAQTLDGLHPNDAGHLAILNQILARI